MAIDFNVEPYYDDYSEDKKFVRILFRPGYAVQARELTQLQTQIQKQIERQGNHLFKDGAMVIPGHISYDTKLSYVKINNKYNNVDVNSYILNFIGKTIVGATSGTRAEVIQAAKATSTDPNMLFVKYLQSGSDTDNSVADGEQQTFLAGEVLTTEETNALDEISSQIQPIVNTPFGTSTAASIGRGVYFIKGFFVLVDDQTIILTKFTKNPTYRVGLKITESLVTPETDESLLDNAQNSYNYAAPGAHRYAIDATLTKLAISGAADPNFIELLRVNNGKIQYMVNRTEYAVLAEELARRTYDESGNYTVRPFKADVREYRDNNRGVWKASTPYLYGDITTYNSKYYVAKNSGISSATGNPIDDSVVKWEQVSKPIYNRGIYKPEETVKEPSLDDNGDVVFNENGSQVFTTRDATVADNENWDALLAVGIEPGKAYVYGYEIEKLGTTYVTVNKSRETDTVENDLLSVDYGNYVLVKNLNYVPLISSFPVVTIYNRYTGTVGQSPSGATIVGTARVRGIEPHSVSGYYKLFLFDVSMNYVTGTSGSKYSFNTHAKQFYIAGVNDQTTFTADTAVFPEVKTGTLTVSTTSVVGQTTRFLTEFEVGDWLYLADGVIRRISSITDNLTMTLASSAGATYTGIPVVKSTALLQDTSNSGLIFPLPQYAIKTITDASYYIPRLFTASAGAADSGGSGYCSLTITASGTFGELFDNENDNDNYLVVSRLTGAVVTPYSITRQPGNTQCTFKFLNTYATYAFDIIASVKRNNTGKKLKTSTTTTYAFTTQAAAQAKKIWLTKPDGIRLKSVFMKTGTFASAGATYTIDITSRYTFDTGQTANYYGVSSISLKDGQSAPVAPIQVTFEYFNHEGGGDFFSVNSYPNYKEIPNYGNYSLRDCLDFRPRVDDSSTGAVAFTGGDDYVPKFGKDFEYNYEYYLSRRSKIGINKAGELVVSNSSSSLYPREPNDPVDSMLLYNLDLEPYTFWTTPESVSIVAVENKRYTMRDIGKLAKRIDQLEYYTSLSMLEQDTKNMNIKDADGFDRFKNGFIVDNFTGHNIGDTSSSDYLCSIDFENKELRPFYTMENVDFVDTLNNNTDRAAASKNYQLTGDLITLPYSHVELIKQKYASRVENVNPFAVFTFLGRVTLTPPHDRWFEVNRRPDIVTNVEGNYNTIKMLAEKAGVLGTIWGAWQTQWTGAPVSSGVQTYNSRYGDAGAAGRDGVAGVTLSPDQLNSKFGNVKGNGWAFRRVVAETFATTSKEMRTGTSTSIKESIEYKTLDDKTISSVAIPYIRSRNMLVQIKSLKPTTRYYPFFDKVDISKYCTPADKIVITCTAAQFDLIDTDSNVGNDYKTAARSFGPNPDFALNLGDVITGVTSGCTAVVVGKQILVDGTKTISVVNVIDPITGDGVGFKNGETLNFSISGITATVTVNALTRSHTISSTGGSLTTDKLGNLEFLFNIPNTDSVRFRTGTRELYLLDVPTYDLIAAGSTANASYVTEGTVETKQATVQAIRNAIIVTEQVSENRTITTNSERIISDTGWYDPLAQTFLVDGFPESIPTGGVSTSTNSGGCFITKVDIFFASKDDAIPVTLQLRDVVNGYPGRTVLPFAEAVLPAANVNISANASVATSFVFKSPVYVKNATEYSICLIAAGSTKYKVWISQLGEKNIGTDDYITEQPYAGVFFKSQNASTWTAEQMQDLKFTIHRAKFKTGKFGVVEFENKYVKDIELEQDPIEFTSGSTKVRVNIPDHGLLAGSYVTLRPNELTGIDDAVTGTISVNKAAATSLLRKTVTGTGTFFDSDLQPGANIYRKDGVLIGEVAEINSATSLVLTAEVSMTYNGKGIFANPIYGVSPSNIFKKHTVTYALEKDSIILTLAEPATQTAYGGGVGIMASKNVMYDILQPHVATQKFTNTQIIPYYKGITGKSISGSETPYVADTSWIPITLNENNVLPAPKMIASTENAEAQNINLTSRTALKNSAAMRFDIYSDVDTLSPVIDTMSVSAILINNKINVPSSAMNVTDIDSITVISGVDENDPVDGVNLSSNTIIIGNSEDQANIANIFSGQYITISGSSISGNNGDTMVTDVAPDGSYLTVNKTLTDGGTGAITIKSKNRFFDEITPYGSSTLSKYVTTKINLANPSTFLKIKFASTCPTVANIGVYYKIGLVGSNQDFSTVEYIKATDAQTNDGSGLVKSNNGLFTDTEIDIPDLPDFDSVTIKLVFTSTNSTKIPKVKDLRIIACA